MATSSSSSSSSPLLPFPPPADLPTDRFAVARSGPDDVPQLWDAYHAAFGATKGCHWWAPSTETMRRWSDGRFRARFQDPTDQHFQITDLASGGGGGRVAAFARWRIPDRLRHRMAPGVRLYSREESGLPPADDAAAVMPPPDGAHAESYYAFFEGITAAEVKWDAAHKLNLSLLCTHPFYQGQGLAAALLKPMLAIADEEGVACYLDALENATTFYEKLGFKKVDELVFDRTAAGHEGTLRIDIMIREPRTTAI